MIRSFAQMLRESESNGGRQGYTFEGAPVATFAEAVAREQNERPVAGYGSVDPRRQRLLYEAQSLVDRVLRGDRWASMRFQEAMSTSDFPSLFGDILDRSVLANYAETPYSWDTYCKRATIQDFRQAKIFRVDQGAAVLDGPILPSATTKVSGSGSTGLEQISEYPMAFRTDSKYTDQLYKFGRRMNFAWEVIINDDLDALKDTPALFGRAARRTEEKRVTSLYVSSSGPNSTFFSTTNKNILTSAVNAVVTTNNPVLSITSLMWALIIFAAQVDKDGEPISVMGSTLVVPPALEVTARNIINATEIWANDAGGTVTNTGSTAGATSAQRLLIRNWVSGIKIAVNYYLPVVNTTSGNTAWYLIANPNAGRPAMQQSFLRGHESPELFMKLPNQVKIGEGSMGPGPGLQPGTGNYNPMEGDFETDAIDYKVRHVLGGTLLDPIMAVASTGAGS